MNMGVAGVLLRFRRLATRVATAVPHEPPSQIDKLALLRVNTRLYHRKRYSSIGEKGIKNGPDHSHFSPQSVRKILNSENSFHRFPQHIVFRQPSPGAPLHNPDGMIHAPKQLRRVQ
jgi:hypothetical protein